MRGLASCCIALAVVGCKPAEKPAATTAGEAPAVGEAPAANPMADMAGTWRVEVRPADKDTVVVSYTLWASGDTSQWKMKFDDRPDTMKVNIVGVAGDSVMTRFGPYSSALRPSVMVVTEAVNRLQNGMITGNVTAHYSVTTPDSVMHLRLSGTRAQ